jgi:hypothetical protein
MKAPETNSLADKLYTQKSPLVVCYQEMKMKAENLENQRNAQRALAGELIAAIRLNVMRETFATATPEQVEEWIAPVVARLQSPASLSNA